MVTPLDQLVVELWDPNYTKMIGRLFGPTLRADLAWNQASTATVDVLDEDFLLAARTPGAKLTIRVEGEEFFSGSVERPEGTFGLYQHGSVTARHLWGDAMTTIGWPVPTKGGPATPATPPDQGARAYWVEEGPIEYLVKALVYDQVFVRRGWPMEVEPNQDRGVSDKWSIRFHLLGETIEPAANYTGLHFQIRHVTSPQGLPLWFTCRTPTVHETPLDVQGIITGGTWAVDSPDATSAFVAGWGEGAERAMLQVNRPENDVWWKREVFVDARDIQPNDGSDGSEIVTQAEALDMMKRRGEEKLLDASASAKLELELSDTPGFRYRSPYRVGDLVTVRLAPGWEVTDRIVAVRLDATASGGVRFTPFIGGIPDPMGDQRLIKAIRDTRMQVRKLGGN